MSFCEPSTEHLPYLMALRSFTFLIPLICISRVLMNGKTGGGEKRVLGLRGRDQDECALINRTSLQNTVF